MVLKPSRLETRMWLSYFDSHLPVPWSTVTVFTGECDTIKGIMMWYGEFSGYWQYNYYVSRILFNTIDQDLQCQSSSLHCNHSV